MWKTKLKRSTPAAGVSSAGTPSGNTRRFPHLGRLAAVFMLAICLLATTTASTVPHAAYTNSSTNSVSSSTVITSPVTLSPLLTVTPPVSGKPAPLLDCLYYEHELFFKGAAAPQAYTLPKEASSDTVTASIIPHHLLASDMLSGFFTLAAQHMAPLSPTAPASQSQPSATTPLAAPYTGIILLSTAHYPESCPSQVTTAAAGWNTPFGAVPPATEAVEALLTTSGLAAASSPKALQQDHGVAGLMPYFGYYLPGVPVAACLVSNQLSAQRLAALVATLTRLCREENMLLIMSVDFSHYLPPDIAQQRDEETIQAMQSGDAAAISRFTDENADSPHLLSAFLSVSANLQASTQLLGHSSSAEKLPQGASSPIFSGGVTTYQVWVSTAPSA